MFNTLVFSRNRAAQLDLTLSSIFEYISPNQVFVTYSYSDEKFKAGYEKLKQNYKDVVFWDRTSLTEDIVRFLSVKSNLVCFATDDSIFYRKPEYSPDELNGLFDLGGFQSFSHRLGLNCTNQDPFNPSIKMSRPNFINNGKFLMWDRNSLREWNNYSYPFSVDMNVYRRQDILEQVAGENWETPNFFEAALCKKQIKVFNACLHESSLVTIPANRVQSEFENGHAGVNVDILNDRFLDGERLVVKMEKVIGSHQVMEYGWIS